VSPSTSRASRVLVDTALFAAAEEIREELGGAGAPAPAASFVFVFIVAAVTMAVVIGIVVVTVDVPVLFRVLARLVSAFRVQQLLELATVEKESPAFVALVDHDAVALVAAHLAATLRADQDCCASHLILLV
jgi:hypothetical protein